MEEFFEMIAKALALQHFRVRLGEGYSATASLFSNEGEAFFEQMLSSGKNHVSGDLGEGNFTFEAAQAQQYPELTVWRFRFYGGVDFGGDPNVYGAVLACYRGHWSFGDDPKSSVHEFPEEAERAEGRTQRSLPLRQRRET